jgi:hypothetical protein
LTVLAADDQNEAAWLWLSGVLDEPADQLMALERVLALNPSHPQALAGAQALRQRLGPPPTPAQPMSAPSAQEPMQAVLTQPTDLAGTPTPPLEPAQAVLPPAKIILPSEAYADAILAEDDPFQCVYCGRQTHPDDERCRHCGRSLLAPGRWQGGGYLYFALILIGVELQLALVQALGAYLASNYPQSLAVLPFASWWVSPFLPPAIARVLTWAVVLALMLGDYGGSFGVATVVAVLDLAWAGVGLAFGLLPAAAAQINAAGSVVIFLVGLMAVISQAQARVRLRVVLDRNVEGAVLLHQRATVYAHQGRWALAALHWRKAISRAPYEPLYYKSLGRADAALGRYAEAVRAYKSGAAAAPDDPEFNRLIETVRAHTRNS